jgi:hypothetical protein
MEDFEMNDQEAVEMMVRCRNEIRSQRATIEQLMPKAQAWDQLCKVLNLLPQPSQGYGEDLAWRLDKRIEELKAEKVKPEPAAEG